MSEKIFIKPSNGLKVLKPNMTELNPNGEYVEASTYWRRRLQDKEVEISKPSKGKTA